MAALGPAPDELLGLAGGPPPGAPPQIQIGPEGGGGPPPDAMGGPGGPPGGGGMPPELAALLGGGGGPEGGPGGPGGGGEPRSESEVLGEIRDLCMEYMSVASDDIEKAEITKALQIVQKLFANNQSQTEAAQGVTPAHKGMARAIRG